MFGSDTLLGVRVTWGGLEGVPGSVSVERSTHDNVKHVNPFNSVR